MLTHPHRSSATSMLSMNDVLLENLLFYCLIGCYQHPGAGVVLVFKPTLLVLFAFETSKGYSEGRGGGGGANAACQSIHLQLFILRSSLLGLNSVDFDLPRFARLSFAPAYLHICERREEASFMSDTDNEPCIQFIFSSFCVAWRWSQVPFCRRKRHNLLSLLPPRSKREICK